jgi:ParB/RepB/Spo0J family partition protein
MRLREKYQLKSIELSQIIIEEAPVDEELVESLSLQEQLEPIKVTPQNGKYKLIDGRRRVLAAQELEEQSIIAIIIPNVDDLELNIRALVANAGKPNPMDEAIHMAELKAMGWTHERIAQVCRYEKSRVDWTVHLLDLIPEFQILVRRGNKKRKDGSQPGLPYTTGYRISRLPQEQQEILYAEWEAGQKLTQPYVLQFVRAYQSSLLINLEDDESEGGNILPGLFISGEQMAEAFAGIALDVEYQGQKLRVVIKPIE